MIAPSSHVITIIHFSGSGNTKFVASLLAERIRSFGFSDTECLDGFSLVKALDLGSKPSKIGDSFEINQSNDLLQKFRERISRSTVIGVGAYAYGFVPAPGFVQFFSETVLPSDLFASMQFYFGFGTANRQSDTFGMVNCSPLPKKNSKARFVGHFSCRTPNSAATFMPEKPYLDSCVSSEIQKIIDFSDSLIKTLRTDDLSNLSLPSFEPKDYTQSPNVDSMKRMVKLFTLDTSKCIKCGKCATTCPYSAITMSSKEGGKVKIDDVEDGFPHRDPDRCILCGRCYNICPKEAIGLKYCHTDLRSRMSTILIAPDAAELWKRSLGSASLASTSASSSAPGEQQSIVTKASVAPKGVIMRTSPPSLLATANNALIGVRLYLVLILLIIFILVRLAFRKK
ncbi:hypothetical protein BLNAU_18597 [Blattamonas nauphoetae]|uniref:4Fe-4S ferredoxin-type domain-containing protein n=1 Tax=Blattamonas nauphoetae TaxID=2049346 RepID=A0ABQ9X482_9EUKA|nr:hypothetical protein BLNAU_18597 [Blattamonas nauphoetae]